MASRRYRKTSRLVVGVVELQANACRLVCVCMCMEVSEERLFCLCSSVKLPVVKSFTHAELLTIGHSR